MAFSLDPTLENDTVFVADLALCQVRLMNDSRFPWLLLVPRREAVRDIIDLLPGDQILLMQEIAQASRLLQAHYAPDKLNVAALGNKVAQLHVHVVARRHSDSAWPNPVWGAGTATPYADPLIPAGMIRAAWAKNA